MCRIQLCTSICVNKIHLCNMCQKSPGRKFKKVKLTLSDFFCSATYKMYVQAKSKINTSRRLGCFKKCSTQLNSLYLSFKYIQYLLIFSCCKIKYLSFPTKIKNTFTENKTFISKIHFFFDFNRYIDNAIIYLHLA